MGRITLTELKNVSPFRKVAMATWRTAKDPTVYSKFEVDIEPTLKVIKEHNEQNNTNININHVVGKVIAKILNEVPELNGMIRGSKIYLRDSVHLNYLVNVPHETEKKSLRKASLSSCSVHNAETLKIDAIAKIMEERVNIARNKEDPYINSNMSMFNIMPWWIVKYYLNFASWLIYGLNINLGLFGVPKDPFGSVIITNVGSLGIKHAYAPLVPYTRSPLLITIGAIHKKPWVIDDQVVVREILPLYITYDHRFVDGVHAASMVKIATELFNNPKDLIFS